MLCAACGVHLLLLRALIQFDQRAVGLTQCKILNGEPCCNMSSRLLVIHTQRMSGGREAATRPKGSYVALLLPPGGDHGGSSGGSALGSVNQRRARLSKLRSSGMKHYEIAVALCDVRMKGMDSMESMDALHCSSALHLTVRRFQSLQCSDGAEWFQVSTEVLWRWKINSPLGA
jgi:hypothetical protein